MSSVSFDATMRAIEIAIQVGHPIILIGEPGMGKTQYIGALCKHLDYGFDSQAPGARDQTDYSGQGRYDANTDRIKLYPVGNWIYEALEFAKIGKPYRMFFDEINGAPPSVQGAMQKPINENHIGDIKLPPVPMFGFVMAMNPVDQATNGYELGGAISNRVCQIPWEPTTESYIEGTLDGWEEFSAPKFILPKDWKNELSKTKVLFTSYFQVKPSALHNLPKGEKKRAEPWPSRRSWTVAMDLYHAALSVNASKDVKRILLSGVVGEAAAIEFLGWQENLDLPNIEDLYKNPAGFVLPRRSDQIFVVLSGIVQAFKENPTPARWYTAWKLMKMGATGENGVLAIAAISAKRLLKLISLVKGCRPGPEIDCFDELMALMHGN